MGLAVIVSYLFYDIYENIYLLTRQLEIFLQLVGRRTLYGQALHRAVSKNLDLATEYCPDMNYQTLNESVPKRDRISVFLKTTTTTVYPFKSYQSRLTLFVHFMDGKRTKV